ncbi:hypothetical protein MKX01_024069 [Papaver californicum]|nr:hypothetical protein MKX01_024069 [Papaver californicum]
MATLISHLQQKRKINFQDSGFEEAKKVKKNRIRYTPSLIPTLSSFNIKDLSYNQQESEKPVIRRIKIKYTPAVSKGLSYNQKENKRLIQLSRMLVLDLDHTLLHSVRIQDVSAEEQQYLNLRVSSMKDMDGNNLYKHIGRYTKFRTYTREFLKEVKMGRILEGVLFKSRIVSRDNSTKDNRKNLDHVWEENEKNLIKIEKYNYFTERGHKLKNDDQEGFNDEDGALKSISDILEGVHKYFFEFFPVPSTKVELQEYVKSVDVRPVLEASLKREAIVKISL